MPKHDDPRKRHSSGRAKPDYVVLRSKQPWEGYPLSKDIEDRRGESKYPDQWLGVRSPARPSFK